LLASLQYFGRDQISVHDLSGRRAQLDTATAAPAGDGNNLGY
jgi:hypothetical protein